LGLKKLIGFMIISTITTAINLIAPESLEKMRETGIDTPIGLGRQFSASKHMVVLSA
jgi:hypothetical protein